MLRSIFPLVTIFLLAACSASSPAPTSPPVVGGATVETLAITFLESGVYELTAAELRAAAPAFDFSQPDRIRLLYRGQELPLQITGSGDALRLRFYGFPAESRFTRENVFTLQLAATSAEPPRRVSASAAPANAGQTAPHVFIVAQSEENLVYAPQAADGDHLFWQSLPAPTQQTYEITLDDPDAGAPAQLSVEVWASTQAQTDPDHHVRIQVNGQPVVDESWDGQGRRTLAASLPGGLLHAGTNQITIDIPGDTGAPAEILFIDKIALQYPTRPAARADRLLFTADSSAVLLTGFSGEPVLWDVSDAQNPTLVAATQPGNGEAEFPVAVGGQYAAVGPRGALAPTAVRPAASSPNLRAFSGAEYLAIGPADLLPAIQPLLDYHAANGLSAAAVTFEAVTDQFNHGLPEPQAIRQFLQFATANYTVKPRYILLVGDASYDPLGYLSPPEANRLPSEFIHTVYGGETVSDVKMALLDEDALPDVALGRVPARSVAELQAWTAKTIAYQQQTAAGEWAQRVLAVADGQEASFSSDAQVFLNAFQDSFRGELYAPAAGASDGAQVIGRYLQDGYALLAYFGHGSINMWGKDKLFSAEDVPALQNGQRLPVVINMNCLTGLFTHPKVVSLAETLLWEADGGAVVVLAPTSLTLPTDQSYLSSAFVAALRADPRARMGDIYLQAQRQMPVDYAGANEVLLTFLYFGDPALRLVQP